LLNIDYGLKKIIRIFILIKPTFSDFKTKNHFFTIKNIKSSISSFIKLSYFKIVPTPVFTFSQNSLKTPANSSLHQILTPAGDYQSENQGSFDAFFN